MPASVPDAAPFRHLTVIGTGLIGGSFLMACRQMLPSIHITAVDRDPKTLEFLLHQKLADRVSLTCPTEFADDHLIVLAIHLKAAMAMLETLAPQVAGKRIVVMDLGSCKAPICAVAGRVLPDQFIGGHPLAGKEFSGIQHATPLLFHRKPFVFCLPTAPDAATANATGDGPPPTEPSVAQQQNLSRLQAVVREVFQAHPKVLPPDQHDRYMAYMSHFPQLYAVMLTNMIYRHEPAHLLGFHGGGIDDQLRLAASSYDMWRDIFELNAGHLQTVLAEFHELTAQAKDTLNQPAMATWFERSHDVHRAFRALLASPPPADS